MINPAAEAHPALVQVTSSPALVTLEFFCCIYAACKNASAIYVQIHCVLFMEKKKLHISFLEAC